MNIKKYKNIYDDIWPYAQTFKLDLKKECLSRGIPAKLIDDFMNVDNKIDYLVEKSGKN